MAKFLEGCLLLILLNWSTSLQIFNPSSEVCCQGKVHQLSNIYNRNIFCCGEEAYDLTEFICCDNTLLPRYDQTTSCCGPVAYDVTTGLCCDGVLVDIPANDSSALGLAESSPTDENEETTEFRSVYLLPMLCCGREGYDWQADMCCDGEVRPRSHPYAECCGSQEYDSGREFCCGSKVHPFGDQGGPLFCCAEEAYDLRAQQCCSGQVVDKPDSTKVYQCCGTELQDVESQICCDGQVVTRDVNATMHCCGQDAYDPEIEVCCEGLSYNLNETAEAQDMDVDSLSCCGTQIYSRSGTICCDDVIHPLPPGSDVYPGVGIGIPTACCATSTYSPEIEMCCDGQVVTRKASSALCCGTSSYDRDQDVCCQGRLRTRGSPTESCCGDTIYDMDTQMCCFEYGYHVLDQNDTHALCCGKVSD